jgi:hypothetical protein
LISRGIWSGGFQSRIVHRSSCSNRAGCSCRCWWVFFLIRNTYLMWGGWPRSRPAAARKLETTSYGRDNRDKISVKFSEGRFHNPFLWIVIPQISSHNSAGCESYTCITTRDYKWDSRAGLFQIYVPHDTIHRPFDYLALNSSSTVPRSSSHTK